MRDLDKFLFQPNKFEEMISTSKIVIDTNVLLAAYQYRNITFRELINTLDALNSKKRLVIPSHVITEFFKNRPERIVDIIQTVQQLRDSLQKVKVINKIQNKIPSMEFLNIHNSIEEIEDHVNKQVNITNEKINEYQTQLNNLITELKSLFHHDPILDKYKLIFEEAYFKPDTLKTNEEITAEFKKREKINLPPGYKDGKKTTNGEGDYIIWEHILQIRGSDVIFITADNKNDWVYRDPNGNVISARRELVEEFYEASNGHSLCIVHPSVFLKAYNPSIDMEIIQDLNKNLKEQNDKELEMELELLNDEGNSVVANEKYARMMRRRKIAQGSILLHNIPSNRYHTGEHHLLDHFILSLQNQNDPTLLFEVLRRADLIASDNSISEIERREQYTQLAEWAILNQKD